MYNIQYCNGINCIQSQIGKHIHLYIIDIIYVDEPERNFHDGTLYTFIHFYALYNMYTTDSIDNPH